MDEATSKVIVAVIGVLTAAIWPAVLLWFLYRFREQIKGRIEGLEQAKVGGAEFVFKRVEQLQAQLQKTNLVVSGLAEKPGSPEVTEAAKQLGNPPGELVAAWAKDHGADNPWDMGPNNWEQCLFDLGYQGGRKHELIFENGKLKFQ